MSLVQIPAKLGKQLMNKYKNKKRRGRKGGRAGRMPKRTTGAFASRTEQFSLAATAGVVYDFTTSLADVPILAGLSELYQYYRITSCELRFKPNFDTYVAGGSSGTGTLPYLNFQYDKAGTLQGAMDAANFEQLGTKSIRLDDKTIVRKWKPSVITGAAANELTQFKVSPWMPTHTQLGVPNWVDHLGAVFYISKSSPADAQVYDVDVVLNIQYRKPYVKPSAAVTGGNPPRVTQTTSGVTMPTQ